MNAQLYTGFLDSRDIVYSFRQAYELEIAGSWRGLVCARYPVTKETTIVNWLGAAPMPRKWIGGRQAKVANKYTTGILVETREQTADFDIDDLRRDISGQISQYVGEIAQKAALDPEVSLTTLQVDADTTTSGLCYDGQQFVDTDHSEGSSGTQTNDLTATEIPSADVTTTTKPTPTEAANILAEAIGYQYGYKDDQGDPNVNGAARNFVVFCQTNPLYSAFQQAISLTRLASGADNPLDGVRKGFAGLNIRAIFNPRGGAGTAGIQIYRTDGGAVKPFIYGSEIDMETNIIGAGSELAINFNKHRFTTKQIWGVTYGMWKHAMEIQFS